MRDLSVADVLERAADLIKPEGAWTRGALARTADGFELDYSADVIGEKAVCFCAWGALTRAFGGLPHASDASLALCQVIGTVDVGEWNDDPSRTQAEVVATLREAAALARGDA